jgi:hypothetical protein
VNKIEHRAARMVTQRGVHMVIDVHEPFRFP